MRVYFLFLNSTNLPSLLRKMSAKSLVIFLNLINFNKKSQNELSGTSAQSLKNIHVFLSLHRAFRRFTLYHTN